MPPNPPHAVVSDHVNFVSGKDVMALTTCRCSRLVAASVESASRFEEQADVALVLHRREFLPREHVQRPDRDHHEQRGRHDRPAHLQRTVEQPGVDAAHLFEPSVDEGGQPAFLALRMHESRAHDRRQRHRDDRPKAPPPRRA